MSITQTISTIPTPPTMADSDNFDERAEIFLNALPAMSTELNAFGAQANSTATAVNDAAAAAATTSATVAGNASTASAAATTATTKAGEASASAGTASTAATTATTKAGEAATSAGTASTAATTATTKAGEADASATAAAGSKTAAESARDITLTARDTATAAATTATTKAGEAVTSASGAASAKTDAEAARDTAVAAKDTAVSAKDTAVSSASTATTKAGEASASAIAASASATSAAEIALGNIPSATTEIAGKVELATTAEVQTGTDATRAVTPSGAAATFAPIAKGVSGGDSHNHDGGDGGQISYSSLSGQPAIPAVPGDIGAASAVHTHTGVYAPAANGVTNGDSHNHYGGDGAQISYSNLSDLPTIPLAAETTPANLGSAQPGTAATWSKADHVHNLPSASQVGALASGADINLSDYKVQRPYLQDWAEVVNARGSISGAQTIDLELGNVVIATITAATTFTFSNPPATGRAGGFVLVLTNGGAGTITWSSSPKWASGTAPTLTASGVDILAFHTMDAGTTWRGIVVAKDVK